MGKINQLTFAVANLIAAGEVVDRPASVVKELLENSIDAGADNITVEISRGGISMIRVCDNGVGMTADDLPICIKRHATSKISGAEDLDSIVTLGFRGEALAAISAVSDVKIISKTRECEYGHLLTSIAGGGVDMCEVGCADGTTVIVENLFNNVPARRKFLKKDVTEAIAVSAVVEKIALSRPDIAITYISDGQNKFSSSGDGRIKNTVYAVLGREFASRLIEVKSEYDGISVFGYVGRSDNCRANRNMQNFFINKRYVKSKTATAAIEQAYSSYIAEGKFPVCVLFIDVSPTAVDVNVHPAKLEVKFSNEKAVFEAVYYSVRSAIERDDKKSEFDLPSQPKGKEKVYESFSYRKNDDARIVTPSLRPATNAFAPLHDRTTAYSNETTLLSYSDAFRLKNPTGSEVGFHTPVSEPVSAVSEAKTKQNDSPFADEEHTQIPVSDTLERERVCISVSEDIKDSVAQDAVSIDIHEGLAIEPYRIIGICFNTYILVEQADKLLLIDKHAAHERIIFEKLKSNLKKLTFASQMLMIPINVKLSSEELSAAIEYSKEISDTGFEFSVNEIQSVASVDSIPDMIELSSAEDVFLSMLDNLSKQNADAKMTRDAYYERALYQSSCKAALKGGRMDSEENVKWICDTLMSLPDIKVCPHGRPVITELEKRYIDRQFDRIK